LAPNPDKFEGEPGKPRSGPLLNRRASNRARAPSMRAGYATASHGPAPRPAKPGRWPWGWLCGASVGIPTLGPKSGCVSLIGAYHRPMGVGRIVIAILAVVAGVATAAVAEGQGPTSGITGSGRATGTTVTSSPPHTTPESPESPNTPSNELTHPQMHPLTGTRLTPFTLTFTLREAPGHQGVFAVDYRVQVAAPPGAPTSCNPNPPPNIESGAVGESEQIALQSPAQGWCNGTYWATVFLQRGPYCPPPVESQPPTPCPEFATQDLDTGTASFTIGPGVAPVISVPNVKGLRPSFADRRLKRRHLRVHYTALSNLCAGIPPHGRIILQKPTAGTRVPRGSRVLVQTSCGS
jgi:hypothetical protein